MNKLNVKYYKIEKFKIIDYILIFIIIQLTIVPIFYGYKEIKIVLIGFLIILILTRYKSLKIDGKFILVFLVYSFLSIVQGLIWDFRLISLLTSFSIVFLTSYLLFRLYNYRLLILMEQMLFYWTIICLIIFFFHSVYPKFGDFLSSVAKLIEPISTDEGYARSLIIYTYRPEAITSDGFQRNSGFFHEPGSFATFVTLGIIINYFRHIPLLSLRNLIYVVALITTFSTAGYFSLFALSFLLLKNKNRILSLSLFVVMLTLSFNFYGKFEFLKEKLENQVYDQTKKDLNEETSGRIYGARKSLFALKNNTVLGRGIITASSPTDTKDPEYATYGWLSFVSRFGLIFGPVFMFLFFRGIYLFAKIGNRDIYEFVIFTLVIMINLSSQSFIDNPFFLIFFFIGLYSLRKDYNIESNSISFSKNKIFS